MFCEQAIESKKALLDEEASYLRVADASQAAYDASNRNCDFPKRRKSIRLNTVPAPPTTPYIWLVGGSEIAGTTCLDDPMLVSLREGDEVVGWPAATPIENEIVVWKRLNGQIHYWNGSIQEWRLSPWEYYKRWK